MKTSLKIIFAVCLLAFCAGAQSATNVVPSVTTGESHPFNVREFGAKGDGITLDTASVNRAIIACNGAGGGIVRFPEGIYNVGTIELLSKVTLFLDAGSVIKGSSDVHDYPPFPHTTEDRNTALIVAFDAHDIAITGQGTIDGNGAAFAIYNQPHLWRDLEPALTRQGQHYLEISSLPDDGPVAFKPRPGILILLLNCQGIQITGIKIFDAPNWCLHVACSQDVVLSHLEIKSSLLLPNSDGIDASLCSNVRISDCNIEAGDDAIAFSPCADGFGPGKCENVVVENCTLLSRSAAIRIGWGAHNFKNLSFNNIIIRDSNRGIGIFVRDGETIENVVFSNFVIETRLYKGNWWGKGEPILLSAVRGEWSKGLMGQIKNIAFTNMTIKGQQGIVVAGCKDSSIENVRFDKISFKLINGPLLTSFGGNFDFRPAHDDHLKVFKHDIPALYAGDVKELTISRVDIDREASLPDFFRYGLEVENFEGLTIDAFRDQQFQPHDLKTAVPICLRNGRKVAISNCAAVREDSRFVYAAGVEP